MKRRRERKRRNFRGLGQKDSRGECWRPGSREHSLPTLRKAAGSFGVKPSPFPSSSHTHTGQSRAPQRPCALYAVCVCWHHPFALCSFAHRDPSAQDSFLPHLPESLRLTLPSSLDVPSPYRLLLDTPAPRTDLQPPPAQLCNRLLFALTGPPTAVSPQIPLLSMEPAEALNKALFGERTGEPRMKRWVLIFQGPSHQFS